MNNTSATDIFTSLHKLKSELESELDRILGYWLEHTIDHKYGGFYGRLDRENVAYFHAPKGVVLNARILWTFSAAYSFKKDKTYLQVATKAYDYFINNFIDHEHGGVYWSLDYKGRPLNTRKQFYALAFAVYGLSEYARIKPESQALHFAQGLVNCIQMNGHDIKHGGYIEGRSRDWTPLSDQRLSEKDLDVPKSMNTHLHIVEAYSNIYRLTRRSELKEDIRSLLTIFQNQIINKDNLHLKLFFDLDWVSQSKKISYGHDIEAAWLLADCARSIDDAALEESFKGLCISLAKSANEAIDDDGGLMYEYDETGGGMVAEKHWWAQAEAMIGYFDAWRFSRDQAFLEQALRVWEFIKTHILDDQYGEWIWGLDENGMLLPEDKVGMWKCPYHNTRACIEIINRIDQLFVANN